MEILHCSKIWEDTKQIPLNISIIKQEIKDNIEYISLYYTAYNLNDGDLRAYMNIRKPVDAEKYVLFIDDPYVESDIKVENLLKNKIGIIEIDYKGFEKNKPHHTMYPISIEFCNFEKNNINIPYENIKASCWYYWTLLFLQGSRALENLNILQYSVVGVGISGVQVIRLLALSMNVTNGIVLGDCVFKFEKQSGKENNYLTSFATYDNSSFIKLIKKPIFFYFGSNIEHFDDMILLYNLVQNKKLMLIETNESFCKYEKIDKIFNNFILNNDYLQVDNIYLKAFYSYGGGENAIKQNVEYGGKSKLSKITNIEFLLNFNNMKNNIEFENQLPVAKVDFFYSNSISKSAFKFWLSLSSKRNNINNYIAKIEKIYNANLYCFAKVKYENGLEISSNVIRLNFESDLLKEKNINHLFYNCESGERCWTSSGIIFEETGPFNIKGIGSTSLKLSTYKIGDSIFRLNDNSILQLLIYSSDQCLTISIESIDHVLYLYKKILPNSLNNWTKVTVLPEYLVSDKGVFEKWSNAGALIISGEKKFLLSKIIWI